ncbi:MAG: hypothetical protein RJB66_544 [Pseudomonadota bacterium]|jgi:hypothetical protein
MRHGKPEGVVMPSPDYRFSIIRFVLITTSLSILACQKFVPFAQEASSNWNSHSTSNSNAIDDSNTNTNSSSFGSGGAIEPGALGRTPKGAIIYIPQGYRSSKSASSVLVLWNSSYQHWKAWADQTNFILIDTNPLDTKATTICNGGQTMRSSYVDQKYILTLLAEARELVLKGYNVDRSKIFYAGWSHGGDLAMKFASLPQADSLAPDDRNDVFCSPHPDELLELQKAAHVGQQEVAGVLAFPGQWGFNQINMLKQTYQLKLRQSCFAFVAGGNDSGYSRSHQILANELQKIPGYSNRVYQKVWPGYGHNLNSNTAALNEAMNWLLQCQ